jgi:hypothetical protein
MALTLMQPQIVSRMDGITMISSSEQSLNNYLLLVMEVIYLAGCFITVLVNFMFWEFAFCNGPVEGKKSFSCNFFND